MAESERMAALKKAYADIILNTAKEAAERVLASEKKAMKFQQDIAGAKEEALRLLLRLKQMIDAKVKESVITSSNQQSRIDVLEAQLQEAENVIIDLREELKWACDKLKKVRNNQGEPLKENIMKENEMPCPIAAPAIDIQCPSNPGLLETNSEMKNRLLDEKNLEQIKQLSACHVQAYSSHNKDSSHDKASLIMRNNEPELCRNGCTQRIRASERNVLAGKLPSSGVVVNQNSLIRSDLITETSNKGNAKSIVASSITQSTEMMKNFAGEEAKKHVMARSFRRRKARFRKIKAKCRSFPTLLAKPYQPPAILSCCKSCLENGNVKSHECSHIPSFIKTDNLSMKNASELEEKLKNKNSCFAGEEMVIQGGKRHRKEPSVDTISTSFLSHIDQHCKFSRPSPLLTHCRTYSFSLHGNVKSGEDQSKVIENEVKLKPLPRLDPGLTLIKGGVDPISSSTNVKVSVKALNGSGVSQNAAKKDVELIKQGCDTTVNSALSHSESNPEMVDVPLVYSDLKSTEESTDTMINVPQVCSYLEDPEVCKEYIVSPFQVDKNRTIKYTFQRKRKKEALSSSDQSTSLEKITIKTREGEYGNDTPEGQKFSLLNEPSRDKRRLAQVARQLMSLSSK